MGRRVALAGIAVAAVLLISLLSRGPGLGHPTFVARANEICVDVRLELGALPTPASGADPIPYLEQVIEANRAAELRFRALEVPSEDEPAFVELIEAVEAANDALAAMIAGSRDGDADAVDAARGRLEDARGRFDVLADFLDLTECRTAGS